MTRKKKKTTGSLRGFALLLILIAATLFLYQHQEGKSLVNNTLNEIREQ